MNSKKGTQVNSKKCYLRLSIHIVDTHKIVDTLRIDDKNRIVDMHKIVDKYKIADKHKTFLTLRYFEDVSKALRNNMTLCSGNDPTKFFSASSTIRETKLH